MPQSSYDQILATIRARQTDDARVNLAAQNVNPQLAQGTVAHANAYPFLSPQTAYSLAAAGAQPGDPLAQAVATGVINHKGGGFWGSLGHIVTAPMRAAVHLTTSALGGASDFAQPVARGILTAAETPLQVGMGAFRDIAAATGDIGAGIAAGAGTGAAVGALSGGGVFSWLTAPVGAAIGGVVGGVAGAAAQQQGIKIASDGIQNPLAQSTGGLALGNLISGNKVDLGSGFLPGGKIHEQQIKNAEATASINGHALTPGRMLASAVVRPGTRPYNLLSGLTDAVDTWELDPTRYIAEEAVAQRAASKFIPGAVDVKAGPITKAVRSLTERSGQLATADPAIHPELAREFLTTDGAAQKFINRVADTSSAEEIIQASKGKIPASIANELAAKNTPQEVLDALLNHVESGDLKEAAAVRSGRDIASTFTAYRPAARLNSVMERLGGIIPKQTVDLLDVAQPGSHKLDVVVNQARDFMTQARFDPALKETTLNRLMASGSSEDAARVLDDMTNGHLRDSLRGLGHDETVIDWALKGAKADTKLLETTAVNELAENTVQRSFHTGEELLPAMKPEQLAEYTRYSYHLPDPSEIRRLTTPQNTRLGESLSALYNSDGWKSSTHAGDWVMQNVFKKAVTVRPALATRTLGMAHVKMAANGLQTRFSDMGSLFRMITNPEFRTAYEEGAIEGAGPLAKAEHYLGSLRRMSGGFSEEEKAAHQIIVGPGHDLFPEAWGSKIAELHADPVARSVAGQGFEGTANDFWDGPLAAERQQLAVDLNRPELASSRAAADAYVRDEIGSHLSALTADNPHLMEAIATGHIPDPAAAFGEVGTPIPLLAEHADGLVNPDAVDHLAGMALDDSIRVPTEVPAPKDTKLIDPDYGHKVGRMTKFLYSTMIGKPMDFFYNSPALNQLYWRELAGQSHLLDSEALTFLSARMADVSGKVNIPDEARKILEARVAAGATGKVTLEHLDTLAQARSVDALQNMTIDMAKKTGWQDASRLMIPFGKHWQQEITQWAKIAVDHPEAYRKAQMTVQGAVGSGFFHKDQYGKYVFNYPGSELISKVISGVPTPMTASAAGLSMISTTLMPGFGPIVSVAASKILPNRPEFDDVRNFFAPMGDPTRTGVIDTITPTWARTLQTALADPETDRDTGNTTMQVAKYLVSTGKFTMDTPEEVDRTLKEAGSRAKRLLTLQAMGQFVLPSSPKLTPMAGDKDGRTVVAKLLSDDLLAMRKADYKNSTADFLDKYGDHALLFLQSRSRPLVAGGADTKEQYDFARSNPEVMKALPNTYAFFAPQGGQTFDMASTARQIAMGEKEALTPKQQVALANNQVGNMRYYQIKDSLGPKISSAQTAVLAQIKDALRIQYPGFDVPITGLGARVTDDPANIEKVVVPELNKALADPKTANSDTGKAVSQYLQVRDAVQAAAEKRGYKGFQSAAHADDLRNILRQAGHLLAQDNPGFGMMFEQLLSKEMRTDTTGAVSATNA